MYPDNLTPELNDGKVGFAITGLGPSFMSVEKGLELNIQVGGEKEKLSPKLLQGTFFLLS